MVSNCLFDTAAPGCDRPNLIAVDTETTLIKEPIYGWNSRTRISPPVVPDLVLGSIAGNGRVCVYAGDYLRTRLLEYLTHGDMHLVFHNAAFDLAVLSKDAPTLATALLAAVNEGRIHDTMILEVLIQIAIGSRTISQKELVRSPSLADLARRRCGMDLQKGDIRVQFGQFKDRFDDIPIDYLVYAARDAEATYCVYQSQSAIISTAFLQSECRYPVYTTATTLFGVLTENIQLKGSLAFGWLERHPLRVDLPAVAEYKLRLETEAVRLEAALCGFEWARRTPKTKKFSIKNKVLREALKCYASNKNVIPEYTPTGQISLRYDFWAEYIPKITEALLVAPEGAGGIDARLRIWLRYLRVQRLFSRYLRPYASAERHYPRYFNIGARTGRSSASCPPVQQIPKRRDGIRNLFIPEDGYVFIEGDFVAAELVALAQTYKAMYGKSFLGEALSRGDDPHIATARRLAPDFDKLSESAQRPLRQAAKAINFGLPGGLGSRRFAKYAQSSYGLYLNDADAKKLRDSALLSDPELSKYLDDSLNTEALLRSAAGNLGMSTTTLKSHLRVWINEEDGTYNETLARHRLRLFSKGGLGWPIPCPPNFDPALDLLKSTSRTLTGRLRGNASYTESHNFPFQGLVADAMKLALWNLYLAARKTNFELLQPVASIHDSILIQTQKPLEASAVLKQSMEQAMKTVCPDILGNVEIIDCGKTWGKKTDYAGKEQEL